MHINMKYAQTHAYAHIHIEKKKKLRLGYLIQKRTCSINSYIFHLSFYNILITSFLLTYLLFLINPTHKIKKNVLNLLLFKFCLDLESLKRI